MSFPTTRSGSSPTWERPASGTSADSSLADHDRADYQLANRFDEIDTMIVFDDVEIPDLLVGIAHTNAVQTGVKMHQVVREKLAELACHRESIHAHLTAAVELAEPSPPAC